MRRASCIYWAMAMTWVRVSGAERPQHPTAVLELARDLQSASCVNAAELTSSVERRLRRRVFELKEAELRLRVDLRRSGASWTAELQLSDGVGVLGRRELSTSAMHCSSLDDSLALVVALLVDTPPQRPVEIGEIAREPVPPTQRESSADARVATQSTAATPLTIPAETLAPRAPWRFDVRVAGSGVLGLLPGLSFGYEVALGVRPPHGPWLRLLAAVAHSASAEASDGAHGADVSVRRLGVDVCGLESWVGRQNTLCVGQRLASLEVTSTGFDRNEEARRMLFSLVAGAERLIPLSTYFSMIGGAHLEVPFTRDRFNGRARDGAEIPLFRASPVAGSCFIGLRVEP